MKSEEGSQYRNAVASGLAGADCKLEVECDVDHEVSDPTLPRCGTD